MGETHIHNDVKFELRENILTKVRARGIRVKEYGGAGN